MTVTISGLFGVQHTGGPAERVPISETREINDPALAFLAKPNPIRPNWDDFDIGGQSLFPACQDYLERVRGVALSEARRIAGQVHGTNSLSFPPSTLRSDNAQFARS